MESATLFTECSTNWRAGDPETIRTSGLQIRNLPLYPAELRGRWLKPARDGHLRTRSLGMRNTRASSILVLFWLTGTVLTLFQAYRGEVMKLRLLFTMAILALGVPVSANAGPRQDALEALEKCAAIADGTARLSCYDSLAPNIKAAAAAPPEQFAGPGSKEQQESWFGLNFGNLFGSGSGPQSTPQQFGSERLPQSPAEQAKDEAQQIDSITATLTEYAKNPFGKFVVFLDNGQAWHQLQGDSGEARFAKNPRDNKVTISRALLGSYSLTINDSERTYKVERIK